MKLDNFILEVYNEEKEEHKAVIEEISKDEKGKQFLGTIETNLKMIERRKESDYLNNNAYIAYYNKRPVGYISLTHYTDIDEELYEVASGILKKERGVHLGELLLQEFSEKIFEERKNIDKLTLIINNLNTGAIKAAKKVGYELTDQKVGKQYYSQKRR